MCEIQMCVKEATISGEISKSPNDNLSHTKKQEIVNDEFNFLWYNHGRINNNKNNVW